MDLNLLYNVSYGLYVVSVMDGERPTGCIINTCMQITSENPVFSICLNKSNFTYETLKKTKRFSVSILSEETPAEVISNFGFFSGRERNKYDGMSYAMHDGLPVLTEKCAAGLLFDVISVEEIETHAVILARLTETVAGEKITPMTYSYYHKVVKGKAPKGAPTYQETETQNDEAYVCTICGYVYEGDLTKEPDSFICPVCKVSKDKFVKKDPEESATYVCKVCGYIYEGDLTKEPDDYKCPICGVGKEKFEKR